MPRRRTPSSLTARDAAALAALLAGALALRLVGIRYGLPLPLLNPDEQSIVPRSWEIANGGGLDPDWFDYPSLLMYLLAPLQALADAPSYLGARVLVAVVGTANVAAAWWLGRRAYGSAAGWVAGTATAVATAHVAYSHAAVTDVPLTLGVTATLALAAAGRIELAGVVAGLATSVKYPGVFLALPVAVAAWGRWRRVAVAAALALAAFAVTSPFVLLRPLDAWDDASRVQRLARAGWLGFEDDHPTPLAFLDRLWESLGPFLALALAGLLVALVRRRRADLVLASFVLVYYVQLLALDAHFDRYVLPLVPALAVLGGSVPRAAPLALALLVVPLWWSVGDDRELLKRDARLDAHAWLERHVGDTDVVAVDPSAPPPSRGRVVRLELPGPGRAYDPNRDLARLRANGVDYVFVAGAVADRVVAAADRYPREARFYADLDRRARRVLIVRPDERVGGRWAAVYRL